MAGLAAAERLSRHGVRVQLYEARRQLGGRAGSFAEPETGETIDHCQHVAMDCCTHYLDLCRQLNCQDLLQRSREIPFLTDDGKRVDLKAAWLPAPLHLAPFLLRLHYLPFLDRLRVAKALFQLARVRTEKDEQSIGAWLRENHQSNLACERFWGVVLVSALGETMERASLAAARKVFVDGFMHARNDYAIHVPKVPLHDLYAAMIASLRERGVRIEEGVRGQSLQAAPGARRIASVQLQSGAVSDFDAVICAVDWKSLPRLLDAETSRALGRLPLGEDDSAPISSAHLWLDRPIHDLPHAVLIGRLSQWVFQRQRTPGEVARGEFYYQVVISASRDLLRRDRDEVIAEVHGDLAAFWPLAAEARLRRARLVTQRDAVFSYRPGLDMLRPPQTTSIENLYLAGDWTRTGWPATMEGAVRSGNFAADAAMRSMGLACQPLPKDSKPGLLTRLLLGA